MLYSFTNTAASVTAFILNSSNNAVTCLNYTFNSFTGQPIIQFSPQLTKVLIMGPVSFSNQIDLFYVDYQNLTSQNISFPQSTIYNPATTYFYLEDRFIYIRQVQDPSVTRDDQEFVYYFAKDIVAKSILANTYTKDTTTSKWVKTIIVNGQGSSYLLT